MKRPLNITDKTQHKAHRIWKVLTYIICIGTFVALLLGTQVIIWNNKWYQNLVTYLYFTGTHILIAGACFAIGGLAGFLFGIPRMIGSTPSDNSSTSNTVVGHNDNLVQISDWLTKIIVGVGLTQLHDIPAFLLDIGNTFAKSFSTTDPILGRNAAVGTILFFLIIGFLMSYLWTRIYFITMLDSLDDILNGRTANTDTQKGKWGGKSEANGRKISAVVVESINEGLFDITVSVASTVPTRPLSDYVKFHLPDFCDNNERVVVVKDEKAVLELSSFEKPFTIGAEVDNGNTILELDLSTVKDVPIAFKNAK